jgi:folylpolyglutamate synthase
LTLLAFHAFLSLGVEATVLEVGIGGLYDSTNIVPKPIVTGISALGLDHTAVLGNTIEEIATNKAGIYKDGVPALSVPQDHKAGGEILKATAEKVGAPFEVVEIIPEDTTLGVPGNHQRINASLAVGLARHFLKARSSSNVDNVGSSSSSTSSETHSLPESFRTALAETKWPGRCQLVLDPNGTTRWLLDGAHTTESLTSCGQWAFTSDADERKPEVLIFNCSGGRAAESLLGSLLDAGAKVSGKSVTELGSAFEEVVFCTNVTYADGNFKGGKSNPTPVLYHRSVD